MPVIFIIDRIIMSTISGLTFPFYNRRAEKARLLSFAELALASIRKINISILNIFGFKYYRQNQLQYFAPVVKS